MNIQFVVKPGELSWINSSFFIYLFRNTPFFTRQVYEAKFSCFSGGHVQRVGNSPGEVRALPGRGKGDAVLRWYVKY